MADKKKSQEASDVQKFLPDEYLDRHCVTTYLKDAITLMLENRPEDPIEFLAEYFQNVITGTSPLVRSYRYVKLTPRNRAAFIDNLVAAYQSMHQVGELTGEKEEHPPNYHEIGVCVQDVQQLVRLVCADFPEPLLGLIETILKKPNAALVSFQEFATTMNICLLFDDLLILVQQLFHSLDVEHTGKVPSNELIQLLQQQHQQSKEESLIVNQLISAFNKSTETLLTLQEVLTLFIGLTKV